MEGQTALAVGLSKRNFLQIDPMDKFTRISVGLQLFLRQIVIVHYDYDTMKQCFFFADRFYIALFSAVRSRADSMRSHE